MGTHKEKQPRGKIRVPVALMLVLCMSAAVFLGVLGVYGYTQERDGAGFYGSLSGAKQSAPQATPEADLLFVPRREAAQTADEAAQTADEAVQTAGEAQPLPVFRPQGAATDDEAQTEEDDAPAAPTGPLSEVDFDALRVTCPDIVGWIEIPGTVIDYPIVQGEDNIFYLKHLPDGTANVNGSIMMDQVNSPVFADDVTILHGHHMRSGAMFGDLDEYEREAYYLEHPMMRLYTPAGDYDVAIFAAYSVDGATFAYPTVFSGREGFEAFLHRARTRSYFQTDVEVEYGDRILMLSTCAYAYENERFLVVGKILEE